MIELVYRASAMSSRSLRVHPDYINKVKTAVKHRYPRQKDLAEDLGFSLATVNNFLNGKPVDNLNFHDICRKLDKDKKRTPFNIGHEIQLHGFSLYECHSLIKGLEGKVNNPQKILQKVLDWTGGQPFLTQKLCQYILTAESTISADKDVVKVEQMVQSQIIENWEAQDNPEHLRTIRDRIVSNEQRVGRLLGLYQQILEQGELVADGSHEQMELRLSGLVVREQSKLKINNRIYKSVFDQSWVERVLGRSRNCG